MKSSQQILGLPVLSIGEGKQIGKVKQLVLNPQLGKVDFLLVEDQTWYLGPKAIAYKAVQGIGEFALTVLSCSSLISVTESAGLVDLLKDELCLPDIQVLSNKGRLLGYVSEYFVDDSTGVIMGCQLITANNEKPAGIIPKKSILTYGRDFLVVEEGVEKELVADLQEENVFSNEENAQETVDTAPAVPAGEKQPAEALKHFEDQQRQYLLGRKVTMRIVADNGEVVAEENETITDKIIERAKATDRYIQLTMNIRE